MTKPNEAKSLILRIVDLQNAEPKSFDPRALETFTI